MTRLEKFTLETLKAMLSNPAVVNAKDVEKLENFDFASRFCSTAINLATITINKIDNSQIKAKAA